MVQDVRLMLINNSKIAEFAVQCKTKIIEYVLRSDVAVSKSAIEK